MIIFFDKKTGEIQGTVDGRIHNEDHLKVWIGDKEANDRIVVNWKPVKWFDKDGKPIDSIKEKDKMFTADFAPDHSQGDIFVEIDKKPSEIHQYKVDTKTKLLIKK